MKSLFYVATRSPSRAAKSEIIAAIEDFMSSGHGEYDGDMVIGHSVINHCIEKRIPFTLTYLGDRTLVQRIRA